MRSPTSNKQHLQVKIRVRVMVTVRNCRLELGLVLGG